MAKRREYKIDSSNLLKHTLNGHLFNSIPLGDYYHLYLLSNLRRVEFCPQAHVQAHDI